MTGGAEEKVRAALAVREGIPAKPASEAGFKSPARWLLSSHLIGSLKQIAAFYTFSTREFDLRDWMQPSVDDSFAHEADEFWFDYIADTGDGQLGVYDIAYLCLSDLHCEAGAEANQLTFDAERPTLSLPRGRFLMVGGDTAYPVADYATLASRLQAPFEWAFVDRANETGRPPDVRPLYGIPGNHDYYNELDGFNRQFRRPLSDQASDPSGKGPQLSLGGFCRTQETSYVALKLPHDWWLWGFDSETANDQGKLDFRQTQFFRGLCRQDGRTLSPPSKLIVATSEPAIARRLAPKPDDPLIKSFAALGLKHPLLAGGSENLAPGSCRLDLSGDTHHYERYDADPDPTREEQDAEPCTSCGAGPAHYASVVSGLGGAFLHPSDIYHSGPARRAVFPSRAESRRELPTRLLNPLVIIGGGFAAWIGGLIAALNVLALFASPSCRAFFHWVLGPFLGLGPLNPADLRSRHQFVVHLWFLVALLGLVAGLWGSASLRRWYQRKCRERERSRAWKWLARGIAAAGVSAPLIANLTVGTASARAFTVDVIVALLGLGLFFGLTGFAVGAGAENHRWPKKVAFLLLGLSHGLVQLLLPLAIVRAEAWPLAGALAALPCVLWAVRRGVGHRWPRGLLPVLWFLAVAGAFAILHTFVAPEPFCRDSAGTAIVPGVGVALPLCRYHTWTALAVVVGVLAGGTYLTAFWFGLYLAAGQEWFGHCNDVGGAARIGKFQQLVRFRLTAEGLTGYVIAIDAPEIHGKKLRPRIIDKFTIAPSPPQARGTTHGEAP